jgi:hypothetical protein
MPGVARAQPGLFLFIRLSGGTCFGCIIMTFREIEAIIKERPLAFFFVKRFTLSL